MANTVLDDDENSILNAIDAVYYGTGTTKEKEDTADKIKKQVDNNELEDTNTGDWKKPFVELYKSSNKWLKDQEKQYDSITDTATIYINYDWYKNNSDISIFDRDKFKKELFDTTEIQEKYKSYLKGTTGVNGDPIGIKLQSGKIMADERAFRARHAPIARLLSSGIMSKNNFKLNKEVFELSVGKLRELEDEHWKQCHTDRPTYKEIEK